MKTRTLALLSGVAVPLVLAAPGRAGYLGITITAVQLQPDVATFRVYAGFDRPGEDQMVAVAGTPQFQLTIETLNGDPFYQHPFGDDAPPTAAVVDAFPSLAADTFVTIGVLSVGDPGGQPEDHLTLTPAWPGFQESVLRTTQAAWAVTPNAPQGDPFNPDYVTGDGLVLLGQFSVQTETGFTGLQGSMLVQFVSNGVLDIDTTNFFVSVFCVDDADCDDGDPCNGQETCAAGDCRPGSPSPDCNGNGVLDSCDIAAGTSRDDNNDGLPDECHACHATDVDGDAAVGILDFLAVLADWGPCPPPCSSDTNGDGVVDMDDLLDVLAYWGPCPPPAVACCLLDATCLETTAANCAELGGTAQAPGTTCADDPCTAPMGACCFCDGTCTERTEAACLASGGAYSGDGSNCASAGCRAFGACCLPSGGCIVVSAALCGLNGGAYAGDCTACADCP